MSMKKKNSYFSEQQLVKLDILAEDTGITVAEHLRRAVDYYLKSEYVPNPQNRVEAKPEAS